ncbi:MAG: hypothetical protein GVY36_15540 [Verrucomicrobia bacterium]|nr:hypothetical protein [Verrucomicrobiota bacterium]
MIINILQINLAHMRGVDYMLCGDFVVSLTSYKKALIQVVTASLKKDGRSRYWIAAFRDKNGRSRTKSTKIERLGGSAKERADREKKAKEVAEDFERIALGGHKEEKHLREAAFDVATKAKGVDSC